MTTERTIRALQALAAAHRIEDEARAKEQLRGELPRGDMWIAAMVEATHRSGRCEPADTVADVVLKETLATGELPIWYARGHRAQQAVALWRMAQSVAIESAIDGAILAIRGAVSAEVEDASTHG